MDNLNIAVVGALGAVGTEMIRVLEDSFLPVEKLIPLDTAARAGKIVRFRGEEFKVETAGKGSFTEARYALFSAGAQASEVLAPIAASEGAVVIDNSSQWRMDPAVPLVVPEVNPDAALNHKGIIANPNCSTIQMVVALKPIHDMFRIRRVVVSTYQAVSGSGYAAIEELKNQIGDWMEDRTPIASVYPHQIAFNALPHIDVFLDNGYTKEEMKMVNETHKILDPVILVSPTAVRIPVFRGHSEAVNIETEKPFEIKEIVAALQAFPGIVVEDDPARDLYPMAVNCEGDNNVFVGRIRRDPSVENGLNMWIVSDNLRKGAAANAVQIAETLYRKGR